MSDHVIYGVDFSGSASNAGRNIWITKASYNSGSDRLAVSKSLCAADFLGTRMSREEVLPNLVELIIDSSPGTIFSMDFPFSLPEAVVDYESWHDFVRNFDSIFSDPNDLAEQSKVEGTQTRRETDEKWRSKPPGHWLVKYQTFYGIRDVLGEIVDVDSVSVLPFEQREEASTRVIESYPAATLEDLDGVRAGYTDVTKASEEKRETNYNKLSEHLSEIPEIVERRVLTNDDALDSLACVIAAKRMVESETKDVERNTLEGHIFV